MLFGAGFGAVLVVGFVAVVVFTGGSPESAVRSYLSAGSCADAIKVAYFADDSDRERVERQCERAGAPADLPVQAGADLSTTELVAQHEQSATVKAMWDDGTAHTVSVRKIDGDWKVDPLGDALYVQVDPDDEAADPDGSSSGKGSEDQPERDAGTDGDEEVFELPPELEGLIDPADAADFCANEEQYRESMSGYLDEAEIDRAFAFCD